MPSHERFRSWTREAGAYADTLGRTHRLAPVLGVITESLNAGTCLEWKAGLFEVVLLDAKT